MQQFHFDPWYQENKPRVRSSTSTSGKPKRILSSVYRKMYNLHVQNKQKQQNKKQTAFVHHEKVYNLQMKTSTKTLYRPQFGFSASRKIKKIKK